MRKSKNIVIISLIFGFITISAQSLQESLFVEINGSTFSMGETENDYEGPPGTYDAQLHNVTLSDFWMSKTEITNQQYVDFLNLAHTAGLVTIEVESAPGPDNGKLLVFGSDTAPDEYKSFAITNLDGTRVMKDHDDGDGDGNSFTGVIEPENPLNISYIGFDNTRTEGEKFFVKDPATDFDWQELTDYYNYTNVMMELDSTSLLNDFDSWPELSDLPNNLPTMEEVKNWPASFIRWYGAKGYAMFYNLDLPTEAQWEYAAQGGEENKYATSDGLVNSDGTSANWNFSHEEPALHHVYDVNINTANPFGLYNMAGNVWEWCEDWYSADFYVDGVTDPLNTDGTSNKKVRRGGSWNYHLSTLKAAARASDEKFKGNDHFGFRVVSNTSLTSIGSNSEGLPNTFELFQNYPNPFNPSTIIKFNLPEAQKVTLKIYDILGTEVATLVNKTMAQGSYSYKWNGLNNYDKKVSSGMYIYRISAGEYSKSIKMLLLK